MMQCTAVRPFPNIFTFLILRPPSTRLSASGVAKPTTTTTTATQDIADESSSRPASGSYDAPPRPPSQVIKLDQPALTESTTVPRKETPEPTSAGWLQLSKEQLRQVIAQFNAKPQAAIDALTNGGHWKGEAEEVAAFLWSHSTLSPAKVGEFLSEYKPANIAALKAYASLFQFTGKSFGDALREFLSRFRLPGEAQKIDRIMEAFAGRFHGCNPQAFPSADTAYVLAFSTIMCAER